MKTHPLPLETIVQRILLLCEKKVLLDADLATLYGVETKVLLQAVNAFSPPLPLAGEGWGEGYAFRKISCSR